MIELDIRGSKIYTVFVSLFHSNKPKCRCQLTKIHLKSALSLSLSINRISAGTKFLKSLLL